MLVGVALVFLLAADRAIEAQSTSPGDYDADDDRLIEVSNLDQLAAVRLDLDGDGTPDDGHDRVKFFRAFPDPLPGMGCPADGCDGYELIRSLDFDDPYSYESGLVDRGWSTGEGDEGWLPIGSHFERYTSNFDGNSHTITNLFIDRDAEFVGLFGGISAAASVRRVGLIEANVAGRRNVGPLIGINNGTVVNCYASGSVKGIDVIGGLVGSNSDPTGRIIDSYAESGVSGSDDVGGLAGGNWHIVIGSHATGNVAGNRSVGGLVGSSHGPISTSHAEGDVSGASSLGGLVGKHVRGAITSSYAAGNVVGTDDGFRIGGLAGQNYGAIRGSYASGNVSGGGSTGGLVGANFLSSSIVSSYAIGAVSGSSGIGGLIGLNSETSVIIGSYATGVVRGDSNSGGLVGWNSRPNGITNSYWDIETSGQTQGVGGGFASGAEGKSTSELQSPTSYAGVYRDWNTDIDDADGDADEETGADDPWDFGAQDQYPALRADLNGDGLATWEEFGEQHIAVPATDTTPPLQPNRSTTQNPGASGSCTNGTVVEDPQGNPGLVKDCELLSQGRDALAGRATLNWSTDLPIHRWQGITVEGSPRRVVELRLELMDLSGQIPPGFAELTALKLMSFRANFLSGSIPRELGGLAELRYLDLAGNARMDGTIPPELGKLSNLEHLDLDLAGLRGNIPLELTKLTKLKWLGLGQNDLSGSIPPQLAEMASLETLILSQNQLSGAIPPELGNLANLDTLYLSNNRLTGTIPPELGQLANLNTLYLPRNRLTGTIPPELANLSKLDSLSLRDNQLTGEIPTWLSSLPRMDTIDLGRNSFTGPIPPGLGNLSWLTQLYLFENHLSGAIPSELGNLARLGDFSLRQNELTGPIPKELGNLAKLQSMDLSYNDLTGVIPREFGRLASIQYLTLANNRLTGNIPAELGGLRQLQSLRLDQNQLAGSVPTELAALPMLVKLQITGNELTGCLPWRLAQRRLLDIEHDGLRTCLPPAAEGGTVTFEASQLVDDKALMIVAVGDAANGTVFLDGTRVTYEHDGSETTSDSFSYVVSDGSQTTTGTANIIVTPVNDPPMAIDDKAAVDEGNTLDIEAPALLHNDIDAEDDNLRITSLGNAMNGTVSLERTTVSYQHDGSETTSDSFTYTVSDGGHSSTAQVTVTITPVNDPPMAIADAAEVAEGDALPIETSALLANDSDAENDGLSVTKVGDAVNGKVFLDGATVIYKHDGSETTTASFSYTVSDGADTDTAAVNLTVTPVNDPPVAVADTAEVSEGDVVFIDTSALLENDIDAEDDTLIITLVGDAVGGSVTLDGTTVSFEHDGSETTTAGFSYTMTDGPETSTATVAITVVPVNDPPVAVADTEAVDEGGTLSLAASSLLENDSDAENDRLSITSVGDALNGKVSLNGASVTYEHDGSETIAGSFTYTVSDGKDASTTTVEIAVMPINDPPIAVDDMAAVDEGGTIYLEAPALLYNDTDAEGDTLSITAVGDALNGNVSLDGTTVTFEHDGSESAVASFYYTVTDGTDTATAFVEINVAPVNDPPVAADDRGTVDQGGTLHIETPALLYNDADAENDPLSINFVGEAVNGNVSLDGTTITYEHDGSETIASSFSYTVTDGTDIDTATVEINVVPSEDVPVSAEDETAEPTATPRPEPTATPSPRPVATPTSVPSRSPEVTVPPSDEGRNIVWLIMLAIALAAAAGGGGIAIVFMRRNRA